MTRTAQQKGTRTIDIYRRAGERPTIGLGADLGKHEREGLLVAHGRVSRDTVGTMYRKLQIGATDQDIEELSAALDTMRITSNRPRGAYDDVIAGVETIAPKFLAAIAEINESLARSQSPSARQMLGSFRSTLSMFAIDAENLLQSKPWERGKLTWHDDAFFVAACVDAVARRESRRDRISFSSAGPANCFIAGMLDLAGIRVESKGKAPKEITADGVKHALEDHPAFDSLNSSTKSKRG